jgi:uncharacterized protein (TIGR03067 family)
MKSSVYAALAGCFAVCLCEVRAHAADPDLARLQGKWIVESFEYNDSPVEIMKEAIREFKDDKYTLTPKTGEPINGAAKIDSTQKPKQIDLEVNGRTLKGIYEIDGDTLKLCYTLNGDERPTELDSKPDSGTVLVIHRRFK